MPMRNSGLIKWAAPFFLAEYGHSGRGNHRLGFWRLAGDPGELTFGLIMSFLHYLTMLYNPDPIHEQYRGLVVQLHVRSAAHLRDPRCGTGHPGEGGRCAPRDNRRRDPRRPCHVRIRTEPAGAEERLAPCQTGADDRRRGRSGAGKSTLVNLISRLYDPYEGRITIDGIDVRDLSFDTLRRNIGIVSQEVFIFTGTIAENIAYAKPDCTIEEIIHAAKIANAHDFISNLPDGYDTLVGTGGYGLSGGEMQRISIARAVLHDPKILILDEATASQDTETELAIQEALEKLMQGRTTIAIAHRLSTLRNADFFFVIDRGKVVESGTHEELLEKNGVYAGLVRKHDEALKMREVI